VVPVARGGQKTVAVLQYELLVDRPYRHTQPDLLFEVWLRRQALPDVPATDDLSRLRAEFFAKPQACLRSSPLPKKYGWGLAFDEAGRIALCPVESETYQQLLANDEVTIRKALRSRRA
jgi:hypothetical protein